MPLKLNNQRQRSWFPLDVEIRSGKRALNFNALTVSSHG